MKFTLNRYDAIYPGHPITIACFIKRKYGSFEEASKPTSEMQPVAQAISDSDIPGGGGRVYAAMSLLRDAEKGVPWDDIFEHADRVWNSEHFARHEEGLEQATALRDILKTMPWGTE